MRFASYQGSLTKIHFNSKSSRNSIGKTCTVCGKFYSFEHYHKASKEKDGRVQKCKRCIKQWMQKHYLLNKGTYQRLGKIWRRQNSAKTKIYAADYYQSNKERLRPIRKRWAENNPLLIRAYQSIWFQNNKSVSYARNHRYRARKIGAEGHFTKEDVERMRREQSNKCFYCQVNLYNWGTIDHKNPLSRGGTNWPDNLVLCCRSCNDKKHTKTAEEFVANGDL